MGESRAKREAFFRDNPVCIMCGGEREATTMDHCPPRAMFKDKRWPEGMVFAACEGCNGGSSDDDLIVSWMATLREDGPEDLKRSFGLFKSIHNQHPGFVEQLFIRERTEVRETARRLHMRPEAGALHRDLPVVNIPHEAHGAVRTLASKLTRAVYYKHQGLILPKQAGIYFHWFTNASVMEQGANPVLATLASITAMQPVLRRGGRDLSDQFDYKYSASEDNALHVLQVVFGHIFGFVTMFSPELGRLEAIEAGFRASQKVPPEWNAFEWISGSKAAPEAAPARPPGN